MRRDQHEANRVFSDADNSATWVLRGAVWFSMALPVLINAVFPDFLAKVFEYLFWFVLFPLLLFTPYSRLEFDYPDYQVWGLTLGCWVVVSTLAIVAYRRAPSRVLWFGLAFNLVAAILLTWVGESYLFELLMPWNREMPRHLVIFQFLAGMVLVVIHSLVVIPPATILSTTPPVRVSRDIEDESPPGLGATDGYCGLCDMLVFVRDGQCVTCGSVVHAS